MDSQRLFSAKEILSWRNTQLSFGGEKVDLDWLLDIGGGLGWDSLQRLKIFQNSNYELSMSLDELSSLWIRHLNENIPLQYLIGQCPWRDFQLTVSPAVLIPRQETEIVIDLALKKCKSKNLGRWADLGTGSGALAVGLARNFPLWDGHAVDCSKEALEVAKKNLNELALDASVKVSLGHWWDPLKAWWGDFDLVVANPPYIPNSVLKKLDPIIRDNEPHLALCGGLDGMDSCREIIKGGSQGLKPGGWLIFEHHYDQSQKALECLDQQGFVEVSFEKDLDGVRRFALGRLP